MSYESLNMARQKAYESGFSQKMMDNFRIDELFSKAGANKFRSYAYYFIVPSFLFILLSPGLILSIPPVANCDTKVKEPVAPGRVTWYNAFVHSIVFGVLVTFLFWYGSRNKIVFPYYNSVKDLASS